MPPTQLTSRVDRYVLWLVCHALWTAAVAWVAFQIQQEQIAPAVLFPLLVGAALGAGGWAIWRATQVPGARLAIGTAALGGLLAVIAQDYIGYRHHLRQYDEAWARGAPALAAPLGNDDEMRPRFGGFLASRVRANPVWWNLDWVLTATAAALVTALARQSRTPEKA